MRKPFTMLVVMATLAAFGCASMGEKEQTGTAVGAGAGAVVVEDVNGLVVRVDDAADARVRVRRAHEDRMLHSRHHHVVGVAAGAGDEPLVFLARHAGDFFSQYGGDVGHSCFPFM